MAPLAAVLGALAGLGVWLTVVPRPARASTQLSPLARFAAGRRPLEVAAAVGAALFAGLVTGWVAAAIFAGLAAWTLPRALGGARRRETRIKQLEAIATWTESLRDTLKGAHGIEQTLIVTAPHAPLPIREQVEALALRLRDGTRLHDALQGLADELADPVADEIVAVLQLAGRRGGRGTAAQLGLAATHIRKRVASRRRCETEYAKASSETRTATGLIALILILVTATNPAYITTYSTPIGQIYLLVLGAIAAAALTWKIRMDRMPDDERILAPDTIEAGATR